MGSKTSPAVRVSLYRLFWVFFMGCFLGVVMETLWCYISRGYWASRTGLVYGPFNLVYGFGAALMTLCLCRVRTCAGCFVGGFVLGSIFEYLCSWVQEALFGTVSWQYDVRCNLNGRINLIYSLFWGVLAVIWIRFLYPALCCRLDRLSSSVTRPLAWVLAAFILWDTAVSAAAVGRWSARRAGCPAANSAEELLDERFDDARMEQIYPNMIFLSHP